MFGTAGSRARDPRAPRLPRALARRAAGDRASCCRRLSPVRVRYAETDKMGVVYYANYFVWFEVGRADLLRVAGWSYRDMETDGRCAAGHRSALRSTASRRGTTRDRGEDEGRMLSPVRVEFSYEVVRAGGRGDRRRPAGPSTPRSIAAAGRAGCPIASAQVFA